MMLKTTAVVLAALALAGCGSAPFSGESAGLNIPGQYVTVRTGEGTSIQRAEVIARQRCGQPGGDIVLDDVQGDVRTYRCIEMWPVND